MWCQNTATGVNGVDSKEGKIRPHWVVWWLKREEGQGVIHSDYPGLSTIIHVIKARFMIHRNHKSKGRTITNCVNSFSNAISINSVGLRLLGIELSFKWIRINHLLIVTKVRFSTLQLLSVNGISLILKIIIGSRLNTSSYFCRISNSDIIDHLFRIPVLN